MIIFAEHTYHFLRPDRKNTEQSIVTLMLVNNLEKQKIPIVMSIKNNLFYNQRLGLNLVNPPVLKSMTQNQIVMA